MSAAGVNDTASFRSPFASSTPSRRVTWTGIRTPESPLVDDSTMSLAGRLQAADSRTMRANNAARNVFMVRFFR